MIKSIADFEEATAFELFIVERHANDYEDKSSTEIDLRKESTHIQIVLVANLNDNAVAKVRRDVAPIVFGAAWKILDLLLELAFHKATLPMDRKDGWTIKKKAGFARDGKGDRAIISADLDVWAALGAAYANTIEHRHCLVHRKIIVDPTSGSISGHERDSGRPLRPITREEQSAFADLTVLLAARAVRGSADPRSEPHLRFALDRLKGVTNAPDLKGHRNARPVIVRTALGANRFFDIASDRARIQESQPAPGDFDVIIDIPDGRQLTGRLEDFPQDSQVIDLDALPPWLRFL